MREIKFRAWNEESKEMVYFDWNDIDDGCCYAGKHMIYDLDKVPVMQYTELHDKNGEEIYEGDRVNIIDEGDTVDYEEVVTWDEELLCWSLYDGDTPMDALSDVRGGNIEVIGNIHENPELVEK